MYVILREFRVETGREPEFQRIYGPEGDWIRLFRRANRATHASAQAGAPRLPHVIV